MKIAILNEALDSTGGVEFYLREVASHLARAGHQVLVLAARGADPPEGVTLRLIPGLGPFDPDPESPVAGQALAALAEFEPDSVYLHQVNSTHLLAQAAARWPTVRYIHNHGDTCPSGSRLLRAHRCAKVAGPGCIAVNAFQHCGTWRPAAFLRDIRRVREMHEASGAVVAFLVASDSIRQEMLREGFPAQRVQVLPYFVETQSGPAEAAPVRGRLLFAGRANREKGLVPLVEHLAGLEGDWSLEVRSTGYALPEAERAVRRLKLKDRVLFPGWAAQEGLARSFGASEIVLLPSLWPEPLGIVGIQAGLQGRPVVAFAGGGVDAWLTHGVNGLAVPPGDWAAFIAAIRTLLEDPARARQMGQAGRELAARFGVAEHMAALGRILELDPA